MPTDLNRTTCDGGWTLGMDPLRDLLVRNPPSSGSGVSGVWGESDDDGEVVSGLCCSLRVWGGGKEALIELRF